MMTWKSAALCLPIVLWTLATAAARADGIYGDVEVATVVPDVPGTFDSKEDGTFRGNNTSQSIRRFYEDLPNTAATLRGESYAYAGYGNVSVAARAFAGQPATGTAVVSTSTARWSEAIRLDDSAVDPVIAYERANQQLRVYYDITGVLEVGRNISDSQNYYADASAFAILSGYQPYGEMATAQWSLDSPGDIVLNPQSVAQTFPIVDVIYVDVSPISFQRVYPVTIEMTARAYAKDGAAQALFDRTATLAGITFLDGVTPESLGYDIVFSSDTQSPNTPPVPEPGTIVLLGAGLAGLAGGRRLRQRG